MKKLDTVNIFENIKYPCWFVRLDKDKNRWIVGVMAENYKKEHHVPLSSIKNQEIIDKMSFNFALKLLDGFRARGVEYINFLTKESKK